MKHILTFVLLTTFFFTYSQDYIILKNGEEVESKVLEINAKDIKYKKFSNQDGPTYTMLKSKIFMVKYASGDKDVFNTTETPQTSATPPAPTTEDFKQNSHFTYNNNIGSVGCQFKNPNGAKIYGTRGSEVFIRKDIIYFGFDYTYAKLTNSGKTDKSAIFVDKYLNPMNNILNNELLRVYDLRRWMRKSNMFQGTNIYDNYRSMDINNFIVADNYCLSFEDIQKIVKSYVLNEKEGVGMVINVANLNKHKEYVDVYVTFFDIASREVMYSVEVTGKAGGAGWGKHYATGINNAVRHMFIDQIYKRKYTSNGQIHPKLLLN